MQFAPDTQLALQFVVALGNTVPEASDSGEDELVTQDQLTELLDAEGYSGRRDRDAVELDEVRDTRTRLRRIWSLDRDAAALDANAMLAEAGALPHLVRHDGLDWHLHATEPTAPLAERIRVEAAMALIDVIRSDATDRLRLCQADRCEALLVDLSRNGSRRFCSERCGNRMHVTAYRERQGAGEAAGQAVQAG